MGVTRSTIPPDAVSIDHPIVAVVDDDQSVCSGVQRFLRSVGLTSTTFTSGESFLASLATTAPDCVVLDVRMPVMTGIEVQRRMRESGSSVPVIFISADEKIEQRNEALASGGFAYLRKPFDGQALVDVILSAITRAQGPFADR